MGTKLDVTITYLEQCERPPSKPVAMPRGQIAILRVCKPTVHYYRYLYATVGDPYHWVSRKRLTDDDLKRIITDENVYIYVLYYEGAPAGFTEIDNRAGTEVEIKFFGLIPDYVGKGLGRYFLKQSIDLAWQLKPVRVMLETCTLDHPAALPLYQKLGFNVFDKRSGQVELIDDA